MNFILRKATEEDSEFLYHLRNEETVRHFSLNPDPIIWETHRTWFEKKLASPDSVIFVVEKNGTAIAQTRFDLVDAVHADINIAVVSEFRGKGYGTEIIKKTTVLFLTEHPAVSLVRAYINLGNEASRKSFAKAGYVLQGESNHGGLRRTLLVFSRTS